MADDDKTAEEPQEGAEDTGQQPDEPQPDQDAEQTEPAGKAQSFDDFLAGLDDEHRKLVKSELDRRDGDTRKARNEAKNLRTRLNEATPKAAAHDEAVEAQKTAEQKASEVSDTLKADNDGLRKRLVSQEIRVQAAAKFADPDDPAELLERQVADLLDDDLEPDKQAIADALDDLLTRRPHLAKPDPKPRPPAPTKAQGSSSNGTPTPESQIASARKSGDYDEAIRLEMQKLQTAQTPK